MAAFIKTVVDPTVLTVRFVRAARDLAALIVVFLRAAGSRPYKSRLYICCTLLPPRVTHSNPRR